MRARTASPIDDVSATSRLLDRNRRALLKAALGLALVFRRPLAAAAAADPKSARPQSGDRFVFLSGDRAGQIIKAEDLSLGGPQQLAYPMDPETKIIRDGSLLNQVVLIRLDPAQLSSEDSRVCGRRGCRVLGRVHTSRMPGVDVEDRRESVVLRVSRRPIRSEGPRPSHRWTGASAASGAAPTHLGRRLDGRRGLFG
jgi:hypothetical protein